MKFSYNDQLIWCAKKFGMYFLQLISIQCKYN